MPQCNSHDTWCTHTVKLDVCSPSALQQWLTTSNLQQTRHIHVQYNDGVSTWEQIYLWQRAYSPVSGTIIYEVAKGSIWKTFFGFFTFKKTVWWNGLVSSVNFLIRAVDNLQTEHRIPAYPPTRLKIQTQQQRYTHGLQRTANSEQAKHGICEGREASCSKIYFVSSMQFCFYIAIYSRGERKQQCNSYRLCLL